MEILNQTIGEIEEKMSANDLEVIASVPESPVIVHVDGRRMWRVLENIFNNADKICNVGNTCICRSANQRRSGRIYIEKHFCSEAEYLKQKSLQNDLSVEIFQEVQKEAVSGFLLQVH